MSLIGNYIRNKRLEADLGLRETADRIGCSHTFLGEVERGVRETLPDKWFEKIVEVIPGTTIAELHEKAARSGTLQLNIRDVPPQYQDLGLALARRIEKGDLPDETIAQLLRLLRRDGSE
jgi:transcriptional regulator with XRE-family HTH domain